MLFVIGEEKFQGAIQLVRCGVRAEGFSDQHWSAIADVAGNCIFMEFVALYVAQHGVDGMDQVELGIDESAVEIEDERADGGEALVGHEVSILKQDGKLCRRMGVVSEKRLSRRMM